MRFLFLILMFVEMSASAAVFQRISNNPLCGITMQGPIALGDTANLKQLLTQYPPNNFESTICLNSGGGDFNEGLRLAAYFMEKGLTTVVAKDKQCYSACAVAFMFGSFHDSDHTPRRFLQMGAALGFHAPFVESTDADTQRAYFRQGVIAIRKLLELLKIRRSRGQNIDLEKVFSNELMIRMLTAEPSEMVLIKTVNDLGRFNISLLGGEYLSPDKEIRQRQLFQGCTNKQYWDLRKSDAIKATVNPTLIGSKRVLVDFPGTTRHLTNFAFGEFGTEEEVLNTDLFNLPAPSGSSSGFLIFNAYDPSVCLAQVQEESGEPSRARFSFQKKKLFRRSYYDSNRGIFGPSEAWMTLDPNTEICSGSCQTIRKHLLN